MGRKASVRYWPSRGTWTDEAGNSHQGAYCTTLRGKQHVLAVGPDDRPEGPTYKKAIRAWLDLIGLVDAESLGGNNTPRVVLEHYLRWLQPRAAASTFRLRHLAFQAFCESPLADQPIGKLTVFQVEQWLDAQRSGSFGKKTRGRQYRKAWGDASIRLACIGLHAAFNWAVKRRMIPWNPISEMRAPQARSRARWCLISAADHIRILNAARADFRPVVLCLENTGCRPGELCLATASAFDERAGALIFHADTRRILGESGHKTSGKGKERRIFLSGAALVAVKQLVEQYPSGPLFRLRGKPLTNRLVAGRFVSLRKRLGLKGLNAYSYRHTFATQWLEGGGSIDDLAALLGNSPQVIRLHYSHVADNVDRLRGLAERFKSGPVDSAEETGQSRPTLPFKAAE